MKDYRESIRRRADILDKTLSYEQLAILNQKVNDKVEEGTDPLDALDEVYEEIKTVREQSCRIPTVKVEATDIREALNIKERAPVFMESVSETYSDSFHNSDCIDGAKAVNNALKLAQSEEELIFIGWIAASAYIHYKMKYK